MGIRGLKFCRLFAMIFTMFWLLCGVTQAESYRIEQRYDLHTRYSLLRSYPEGSFLRDESSRNLKVSNPYYIGTNISLFQGKDKNELFQQAHFSGDFLFLSDKEYPYKDEVDILEAYLKIEDLWLENLNLDIGRQILLDGISLQVFDGANAYYSLNSRHALQAFVGYSRFDNESIIGYGDAKTFAGLNYFYANPEWFNLSLGAQTKEFTAEQNSNAETILDSNQEPAPKAVQRQAILYRINRLWQPSEHFLWQLYYDGAFNTSEERIIHSVLGGNLGFYDFFFDIDYGVSKDAWRVVDRDRNIYRYFADNQEIRRLKETFKYHFLSAPEILTFLEMQHSRFQLGDEDHGDLAEVGFTTNFMQNSLSIWFGRLRRDLTGLAESLADKNATQSFDQTRYGEVRWGHPLWRFLKSPVSLHWQVAWEQYTKANQIKGLGRFYECALRLKQDAAATFELAAAVEETPFSKRVVQGTFHITYRN